MRDFLSVLALGLLAAAPVAAESVVRTPKEAVKVALSCDDLKPALRKAQPECAAMPLKARSERDRSKPVLISDGRSAGAKKKMIKMPWVTGVFQ